MATTDEAIILAGGLGTRLRGVVDALPKPLAPVAGRPFLAWLLDALAEQGVRRAVLATGYLGELVEAAFGVSWRGMTLVYSREPAPLGTGGALVLAARQIARDAFLVLNGDTWLGLDYTALASSVSATGARIGVALARVPDVVRYGSVRVDHDRIIGFEEKGRSGPGLINGGVYSMCRDMLEGCPLGEAFSFERDVLLPAVSREPVIAYAHTQGFIDIGIPDDYRRAQTLFARGHARP